MNPLRLCALWSCATLALLPACTSQSEQAPSGALPPGVAKTLHDRSWMEPAATRKNLLYVSDQKTMDVYVFTYPEGKLVGTLTGFHEPAGLCSDGAGHVFVTNGFGGNIIEYAHGGTTPIATLSDGNEYPSGCGVDPASGNLAVTNYCSGYPSGCSGSGSVAVFRKAKGTPKQYADASISHFDFCGYDDAGNLFSDGTNPKNHVDFVELRSGGSSFTGIRLNQAIAIANGVQWDGSHVAVGDNKSGVIYQFSITGKRGTKVGTTTLGSSNDVVQFWLQPPNVIGPNAGSANAMIWKYPAGGSPVKTVGGLSDPVGAAVSLSK